MLNPAKYILNSFPVSLFLALFLCSLSNVLSSSWVCIKQKTSSVCNLKQSITFQKSICLISSQSWFHRNKGVCKFWSETQDGGHGSLQHIKNSRHCHTIILAFLTMPYGHPWAEKKPWINVVDSLSTEIKLRAVSDVSGMENWDLEGLQKIGQPPDRSKTLQNILCCQLVVICIFTVQMW